MSEVNTKFDVVKNRGNGSKWEPTDLKSDVLSNEVAARTRAAIFKHNVKAWRFGYLVVVGGKVVRALEVA